MLARGVAVREKDTVRWRILNMRNALRRPGSASLRNPG
jgi:hypothetical protein